MIIAFITGQLASKGFANRYFTRYLQYSFLKIVFTNLALILILVSINKTLSNKYCLQIYEMINKKY